MTKNNFRKTVILCLVSLVIGVSFSVSGCSPWYVMEAGWKEAGILIRREKISNLLEDPTTDTSLKAKLELVSEARAFAEKLGLKPSGSFTLYSTVDRDVLVWVLSAAEKTSLSPYTWWFPIVGSVPYKGFFEKEDGISAQVKLKDKGLDTYLRPSPAMSTLGWFNDPFLSTMLKYDDIDTVNTVVHEILHNTIWVKDHVPFNETLANVVGSLGAIDYFCGRDGETSTTCVDARSRWHDELLFGQFIENTAAKLEELYKQGSSNSALSKDQVIAQREEIFSSSIANWTGNSDLRTQRFRDKGMKLNNAVIIAFRIYLSHMQEFQKVYERCDNSLPRFIENMKNFAEELKSSNADPFEAVKSLAGKECYVPAASSPS